jgi:hypothetical protein
MGEETLPGDGMMPSTLEWPVGSMTRTPIDYDYDYENEDC